MSTQENSTVHFYTFADIGVDAVLNQGKDAFWNWYYTDGERQTIEAVTANMLMKQSKKGDLVRIKSPFTFVKENLAMFIFNGTSVEPIYIMQDGNGDAWTPKEFKVPSDYPPMYFHGTDGISLVLFKHPSVRLDVFKYLNQIVSNIKISLINNEKFVTSWFTEKDVVYNVSYKVESYEMKYTDDELKVFFENTMKCANDWADYDDVNCVFFYVPETLTFRLCEEISVYGDKTLAKGR